MLPQRVREFSFLLPDESSSGPVSEREQETPVAETRCELQDLLEVIRQGVMKRGFYALMDDRVKFIWDAAAAASSDALNQTDVVVHFAADHGWDIELTDTSIIFLAGLKDSHEVQKVRAVAFDYPRAARDAERC